MIAIAAVSAEYGIGKDNDLIYNIPADKKFFREKTTGGTVIMGRKTFQSLPFGPLKNRENVVLTRDPGFTAPEGVVICRSTEELEKLISERDPEKTFIIGGGEIYAMFIDRCDAAYLTEIDDCAPADKFFPDIRRSDKWVKAEESDAGEHEGITYRFVTYKRV
ncbi:MAG: dihydrofolate reductase [Huintestinicola sp.]